MAARWLLALALPPLLLFLPVLLRPVPAIPGAMFGESYPWYQSRAYTAQLRSAGRLPLWNPRSFCGVPHLAALQSAVLYPPDFLFAVLPSPSALTVSYLLHYWLAGVGVFLLLRELALPPPAAAAGGAIFMLGGPCVLQTLAGHISVVVTLAWTGFVFLGVLRLARCRAGAVPLTALALALQVYAGHVQYAYYTVGAAGAYVVALCLARWRDRGRAAAARLAARCVAALLLAGALAAAQLLPAIELALHSARVGATVAMSATFSLAPESLLLLVAPGLFGDLVQYPYWGRWLFWEMCGYAGIVPLALALLAAFDRTLPNRRHLLAFTLLGGAAVLFAFGDYLPWLYRPLHAHLPGYALFRAPAKLLFLTVFAVAILAAHALAALPRRRWPLLLPAVVLLACLLLVADDAAWRGLQEALFAARTGNAPAVAPDDPVLGAMLRANARFWLWRGLLLLLATWLALRLLRGRRAATVLGLLLLADLGQFAMTYAAATPLPAVQPDERPFRWLQACDRQPFRVLAPGQQQNFNFLLGIDTVEGDDSIVLRDYQRYINASQGETSASLGRAARVRRLSSYTHRLNLRYLVLPVADGPVDGTREVYRDGRWRVLRVADALPRAYWYPRVRVVPEGSELAALADPALPWRTTAVVSVPPPVPLRATGTGTAVITAYDGEQVTVAMRAAAPGLLVLADSWYPGWEALVDGVARPVIRANGMTRGAYVPAGEHVVQFRYRPLTFRAGMAVTLVALAGLTGWLLLRILRRADT